MKINLSKMIRWHSWNSGGSTLILNLLGLQLIFGWAGNCISPVVQFELGHRLLVITLRGPITLETKIYVRLGQRTTNLRTNQSRVVWGVDWDSQHFIHLVSQLTDHGKRRIPGLMEYRQGNTHANGCRFDTATILGIRQNVLM